MYKILVVFGTRPEAIKMCPLVNELIKIKNASVKVCVSGQHKEMVEEVLTIFNVKTDYNLSIMKPDQDLFDINTTILNRLKEILIQESPNLVLVHGDTSTSYVASLACFYLGINVGHVEAGLRTYNINSPFPEEFNRRSIGLIAKYHFTPTENAKHNLVKEGVNSNDIFITGNTGIDALKTTISDSYYHELLDWVGDSRLVLVTAHRRENIGIHMESMFEAIESVVSEYNDVKVIYPIHLNPKVRKIANDKLKNNDRIKIIDPLNVIDFHNFMNKSYLILTDSGGIQEEAPSLGKPVLVMRDNTERPEGVKAGTLKLVGTTKTGIYIEFKNLLDNKKYYEEMSKVKNPYGDGNSCIYIKNIIEKIIIKESK